jgi:hypothetical protein
MLGRGAAYHAWKRPGLSTEWTRVLEGNPDAMNPEPLDSGGKCSSRAADGAGRGRTEAGAVGKQGLALQDRSLALRGSVSTATLAV